MLININKVHKLMYRFLDKRYIDRKKKTQRGKEKDRKRYNVIYGECIKYLIKVT